MNVVAAGFAAGYVYLHDQNGSGGVDLNKKERRRQKKAEEERKRLEEERRRFQRRNYVQMSSAARYTREFYCPAGLSHD